MNDALMITKRGKQEYYLFTIIYSFKYNSSHPSIVVAGEIVIEQTETFYSVVMTFFLTI